MAADESEPGRAVNTAMFTGLDYDKFRTLRITHVASRFEALITDEANDELTPEPGSSPPSTTPCSSAARTVSRP